MNELPTLWYENAAGKRWIPPDGEYREPPLGFVYQRSRPPCYLHESVCKVGGGQLMSGSMGYPADLALAIARPSVADLLRAALRGYLPWRGMGLKRAILIAAVGCERCSNSNAHRYGCRWGYRKGSKGWRDSRTECEMCRSTPEAAAT